MRAENWEIQMLLLKLAGQVRCELLEAGMRSRVELDDHKRNFDDLGEDETFVLSRAQHVVLIPGRLWLLGHCTFSVAVVLSQCL